MRAALYARVSTQEQVEGYSLDAQRRAFKDICQAKGWTSIAEFVEEGKSAHTEDLRKRPVFKQATDAALNHEFDVLVVHKIDRFSRKLKITLEYFDKLHKAGVGFVSISEQMDFTTPTGGVFLAMVGAFSQFYSDNLSQETKKGWAERRAQGLYCGLLPFGAMKGEDGIPVPDPKNHPGIVMAFELSAEGKTDREVALALNAGGYRTTGNHGARPFSKETLKDMLSNRFYLGELPDGKGGWLTNALHSALVNADLFAAAQEMRQRRRRNRQASVRRQGTTYSLSGLARCGVCGSRMHLNRDRLGRPRIYCYGKAQGVECNCRCTYLATYEGQLEWYLANFKIPEDYQTQILETCKQLAGPDEGKALQSSLENRKARLKEMYAWGHLDKEDYLNQHRDIERQLESVRPRTEEPERLERLADFLRHVERGWRAGDNLQRNRLASAIFEEIWIEHDRVVRVRPLPELEPFFRLSCSVEDDAAAADEAYSTCATDAPPGRHSQHLQPLRS